MLRSHGSNLSRSLSLLALLALWIGFPGPATAQRPTKVTFPETPDVPELIIPDELKVEADRLDAEDDDARADREDAEENRDLGLTRPETPIPRFDTPARSLSDLNRDERSIERLRIDCRSELSRRDITLFANGTIRLRQGPWERQEMFLEELGPEEMTTYLKQLVRIRRSEEFPEPQLDGRFTLEGQWLKACRLTVETPGDAPMTYVFGPLELQPLPIGQLIQLADELAGFTRAMEAPERLPVGYEPEIDDVLRGRDGVLYRVVSPTDDGEGVELESLMEPFIVYHRIEDLPELFATKVVVSDLELEERLLAEPDVLDLQDREQGFSAWGKQVETWEESAPPPPEYSVEPELESDELWNLDQTYGYRPLVGPSGLDHPPDGSSDRSDPEAGGDDFDSFEGDEENFADENLADENLADGNLADENFADDDTERFEDDDFESEDAPQEDSESEDGLENR